MYNEVAIEIGEKCIFPFMKRENWFWGGEFPRLLCKTSFWFPTLSSWQLKLGNVSRLLNVASPNFTPFLSDPKLPFPHNLAL